MWSMPHDASPLAGDLPAHTRAAVWTGDGHVEVRSLPVGSLSEGETLVAIDLATVCGSDRHTVSGRRAQPCPSILGHESVGRVAATRGIVRDVDGGLVRVGDRVIWSVTLPCGRCDRCTNGLTAKCRTLRKTGHEALDSSWPLSGGYAQHLTLPAGMPIARVPADVPDALAAPAACATATVAAAAERAGDIRGQRVAIIGAGMLGLTAAALAARSGASEVICVDPNGERRLLAASFGATHAAPSADDIDDVDVLFEFSGSTAALQSALDALAIGGVAVLAGSIAPDGNLTVTPEAIVRRHLTIRGQHNYEPRHLREALALLVATGDTHPWAELVAPPRPLAELPQLLVSPPGASPRYSVAPFA